MTALDSSRVRATTDEAGRSTWALWGTAAGVCGLIANMLASSTVTETQRKAGFDEVYGELTRGVFHVGAVAGFAAVACLVMFAAGFAR